MEVEKSSRPYLAFFTPAGHYQLTHAPSGVAGAPETLEGMVDRLLAGMKCTCALAYLDNLIVFSTTFEDPLSQLQKLFERARKGSLRFKSQQCRLCHPETKYLRYLVSATGIRPDPAKTAALQNFPMPKDIRGVRSSLGVGSYSQRFIRDFARISKPRQDLTHIGARFKWRLEQQEAFEKTKRAVIGVAPLAHPELGREISMACDACTVGVNAVFARKNDQGRDALSPLLADYYVRTRNAGVQRISQHTQSDEVLKCFERWWKDPLHWSGQTTAHCHD